MAVVVEVLDEISDIVDRTRVQLVAAIRKAEDEAVASGHGALDVADETADEAIDFVDERLAGVLALVKELAKAAVTPVDAAVGKVSGSE